MRYLVVLNQVNWIIAQKEDKNIYEKEWRKTKSQNETTKVFDFEIFICE